MRVNKKRIKELLKLSGLKQKEAAEKIGVSSQTFNNWMHRSVFPDIKALKRLAALLNTSIENLKLSNEQFDTFDKKNNPIIHHKNYTPIYTDIATQNSLDFWLNENTVTPTDYAYIPGLKSDFILPFYGTGIEPILTNGDWIALRRITDYNFFNYGEIHLIITQEQVLLRTIHKGLKKGIFVLKAADDVNNEIEIPEQAIKAIFIVATIIKRLIL